MSPLISILIPVYNAERWIKQTIDSALSQTWPTKEVIVVDDGSTDRSPEIIRRFEGRIRWETGPNRGGNVTRNRLLELSRGQWLQYLDADDYLRPEKVERQIEFVRQYPDCDVVLSPVIWEKVLNGRRITVETRFPRPYDPWVLLALWYLPQTGGPLWRRSALQQIGGWRVGQSCCQEHELYFRMLAAGCRFEFCEGCFAVYRDWDHGPRLSSIRPGEVDVQRLLILDRIETCLQNRAELTFPRRRAVNDARHQIARKLWVRDRGLALDVARRIQKSDRVFRPSTGPASPWLYLLTYRLFGFHGAQRVAACKRMLSSVLVAPAERSDSNA
jgi:glycosyltransferase involved in cell wall biosynthesis